jgi:hypothetical protein
VRALRFIIAMVVGLAFLTWGASVIVSRTTREWFDRDVQLRARLAVGGARETLLASWDQGRPDRLHETLAVITRDARIMAAIACRADFELLARAGNYPEQLACTSIGPNLRASGPCGKKKSRCRPEMCR